MNRDFMKSHFNRPVTTDQRKGLTQPPLEKPFDNNCRLIDLPEVNRDLVTDDDIVDIILDRKSQRDYKDEAISLEELSYLLTMTQRISEIKGDNYVGMRPVPSAGGRHPFETYLVVLNVEGLEKGIYRYLPLEHKLLSVKKEDDLNRKISIASNGQNFAGMSGLTFVWSCIPYRTEWRYADNSYKIMLLDVGHICQALYLACQTIGLGTCAIASYDQELMDYLIDVDGEDEFTVYISPVGKI